MLMLVLNNHSNVRDYFD